MVIALASFAVGAAGQLAGFMQQQQSYKAQLKHYQQNAENAGGG
jgi:hypothetical protein